METQVDVLKRDFQMQIIIFFVEIMHSVENNFKICSRQPQSRLSAEVSNGELIMLKTQLANLKREKERQAQHFMKQVLLSSQNWTLFFQNYNFGWRGLSEE